eukprot:Skav211168  [mRNA]  locus=scaffold1363:21120:21695:- [translate_table: standard]
MSRARYGWILVALTTSFLPSFVGIWPTMPIRGRSRPLPQVARNAGEDNFKMIDEVLKSVPDVEAEVESSDPKLLRWKVVWNGAGSEGQFGYQVMLQETEQNKEYFTLQSAFRRPPTMKPMDALVFANQWNAFTPFAHVYVSQDSNLRLEMDVDFKWLGSRPEALKDMISTFSDMILSLAARCRDYPGAPGA